MSRKLLILLAVLALAIGVLTPATAGAAEDPLELDGSMTTVHANTPRDALSRVEQMVQMGGMELPHSAIRATIASAVHFVVQLNRLSDGRRRVMSISEITGMEGEVVSMQEIFGFRRIGTVDGTSLLGVSLNKLREAHQSFFRDWMEG